jgi:hypothetical protein
MRAEFVIIRTYAVEQKKTENLVVWRAGTTPLNRGRKWGLQKMGFIGKLLVTKP